MIAVTARIKTPIPVAMSTFTLLLDKIALAFCLRPAGLEKIKLKIKARTKAAIAHRVRRRPSS
ncbi:unnamed protein product, partial [marine sediment metagenome]